MNISERSFQSGSAVFMICLVISLVGLYAFMILLIGPVFGTWFKGFMGFALAVIFAAAASHFLHGQFMKTGLSAGLVLRAIAALALFLVVLTRGAPHNNPGFYAAYENFGVAALGALTLGTLALGVVAAPLIKQFTSGPRKSPGTLFILRTFIMRRWFALSIIVFSLLAMAAASETIIMYWDNPSWGDAQKQDRIAHLIALGEMPAGYSYYPPVYQYAAGALYWAFGHFQFVLQTTNLLLAPVTVVLLALTARRLFSSDQVGWFAGLLASSHDYLRFTPHMMTIENWYIPAIALSLYAASVYLTLPSAKRVVLLALAAGLVFGLRTQGGFYCGLLLIVPFFAARLSVIHRFKHVLLASLVFVLTLVPWTLRNAIYDGRVSPVGAQSAWHMPLSGDARAFYGIRRDLGYDTIIKEWEQRYPDQVERQKAMSRYGWTLPFTRPKLIWFEAVPWRFLAFYGLVPPGVWEKGGVRPTNWRTEGKQYALQIAPVSMLLLASLLGFIVANPRRSSLFLMASIAASVAVIVFAGSSEARISYPVLPFHILLAGTVFLVPKYWATNNIGREQVVLEKSWAFRRLLYGVLAVLGLLVSGLTARIIVGEKNRLRALPDRYIIRPDVVISQSLADITCAPIAPTPAVDGKAPWRITSRPVRLRATLSSYQYPVKYSGQEQREFPKFTTDSRGKLYFRSVIDEKLCPYDWKKRFAIGISISGAISNSRLLEEDYVEVEGVLRAFANTGGKQELWIEARKVRLINRSLKPGKWFLARRARK